jgi:hypothetical protein
LWFVGGERGGRKRNGSHKRGVSLFSFILGKTINDDVVWGFFKTNPERYRSGFTLLWSWETWNSCCFASFYLLTLGFSLLCNHTISWWCAYSLDLRDWSFVFKISNWKGRKG